MLAEKHGIATRDLTPLIGTEVRCDVETLLSGRIAKDLRAMLETRGVLVFPKAGLTEEQQVTFTQTLGTQAVETYAQTDENRDQPPTFKISLDPKETSFAEPLRGSLFWHLDGSMAEIPVLATILTAKRLSTTGGQTEFCNTYAAYEALPDSDKQMLAGMRAMHANWGLQRYYNPEPSYAEFTRARKAPCRTQPIVWTHRSGRKSLVIGGTAAYVEGLDPLESMDLLVRLRDWATQPQFVYRHEWTVGDMVMWNNTGVLHRALPYARDSGRLMTRTMLEGDEPFA
jgi:alpha-ketoglutarate-dependent taurine dioxygenase